MGVHKFNGCLTKAGFTIFEREEYRSAFVEKSPVIFNPVNSFISACRRFEVLDRFSFSRRQSILIEELSLKRESLRSGKEKKASHEKRLSFRWA